MPLPPEFTEPRLVAVYEALNGYAPGTQPDFYLRTARECGARSVVEVGCGTGLITRLFLADGFEVTGIDPSGPMLDVARAHPGADAVRWIEGDLGALDVTNADFAFMAGHVAQFFVSDDSWRHALQVLHGALRSGGHLAFESRNPSASESWIGSGRVTVVETPEGPVERCTEVSAVGGDLGVFRGHHRFADGEEVVAEAELRFRSVDELRRSLDEAGFAVTQAYGGWDRRPLDERSPEIILVAEKRGGTAAEQVVGGAG